MGISATLRLWTTSWVCALLTLPATGCRFQHATIEQPSISAGSVKLNLRIDTESFEDPLTDITTLLPWQDGTLLISDRDRLHTIDMESGKRIRSIGRAGDGPGEFRSIQWTGLLSGDTVVVFDGEHDRFTHISPDLKVTSTLGYPHMTDTEEINPVCVLTNGQIVARALKLGASRPGLQETVADLRLYARDFKSYRHIDTLRSAANWVGLMESSRGPLRILSYVPFAPRTSIRCGGSSVYWGNGAQSSIARYTNGMQTVISLDGLATIPITARIRAAFTDSIVAQFGADQTARALTLSPDGMRRRHEDMMKAHPYDNMPYYQDIRVSSDGSVWVLAPRLDGDSVKLWHGFDPNGTALQPVRVPAAFKLRALSSHKLWGIVLGPDDVPEIRSYTR